MMPSINVSIPSCVLTCAVAGTLGIASLCAPRALTHPIALSPAPVDTTTQQPPPSMRESAQEATPQFGALVQTILHTTSGPASSPEGFYVPRARLAAEGRTASMAYEVEADFADDVLLKDARMTYRPTSRLTVGAGRFKVPFSYGELVSSAETDFVQRPRAARQLSIGRRTGMDVTYRAWNERVHLQGGVFSGEDAAASSEDWLAAARLTWAPLTGGVRSVIGVNAAYVQHAETEHVHYGADVRLTRGRAFVTTELLAAPNAPDAPTVGAYVTTGYALTDAHLVRAQWDYLRPPSTADPPARSESLVGVGYTLRLAAPLRVEVDYLIPPVADAFDWSTVLVNFQLSF